jgi:hypothetical protein
MTGSSSYRYFVTSRAKVIDIGKARNRPQVDDIFLLDTNILYWYTYPNAIPNLNQKRQQQIQIYLDYVNDAITVGASLRYSAIAFAELVHRIEQDEYSAWALSNGIPVSDRSKLKYFRHGLPQERANVVAQVNAAWGVVNNIAVLEAASLDNAYLSQSLQQFQASELDGYDVFMVESAIAISGITGIITDDADYATASGSTVFTINKKAIAAAKQAGNLQTR